MNWDLVLQNEPGSAAAGPETTLLVLLLAFCIGHVIGWVYMWTHAGLSYSQMFVASLVILPALVAFVMVLMAGDIVAYGSTDLLFCSTPGDYFRKLRRLCVQEILSNDRIRSYQDIREDEVRSLVEDIRAAGPSAPVDLSRKIYKLTNGIVSRAAFGMKSSKAEDFVAAIKHSFVYSTGFSIADLFPGFTGILSFLTGQRRNLEGVRDTIDGILEEIINEREQILKSGTSTASEKNLVEVLLGLQGNEDFGFPITRSTVKAVILVSTTNKFHTKIFTPQRSVK
jgi:cytochrome P450